MESSKLTVFSEEHPHTKTAIDVKTIKKSPILYFIICHLPLSNRFPVNFLKTLTSKQTDTDNYNIYLRNYQYSSFFLLVFAGLSKMLYKILKNFTGSQTSLNDRSKSFPIKRADREIVREI